MTDARNIAHDKKVQQEKKHKGKEVSAGADETPQPEAAATEPDNAFDMRLLAE